MNFNPSQTAVTFEAINNYGVILGLKILFQEQIIAFFLKHLNYEKIDIVDSSPAIAPILKTKFNLNFKLINSYKEICYQKCKNK